MMNVTTSIFQKIIFVLSISSILFLPFLLGIPSLFVNHDYTLTKEVSRSIFSKADTVSLYLGYAGCSTECTNFLLEESKDFIHPIVFINQLTEISEIEAQNFVSLYRPQTRVVNASPSIENEIISKIPLYAYRNNLSGTEPIRHSRTTVTIVKTKKGFRQLKYQK